MIKFIAIPKNAFSFSSLSMACLEDSQLCGTKLYCKHQSNTFIEFTAVPNKEDDYAKLIQLVQNYFEIDSVKIDRTDYLEANDFEKIVVESNFSDSKTNKLFSLLGRAVLKAINADLPYKGTLLSAIQNIDSKLFPNIIDFKKMDIIDVNFGTNWQSELSGGHIWALVVQKREDSTFIVPILKKDSFSNETICLETNNDSIHIDYGKADLSQTVLVLEYSKWVSNQRINQVIGHANPQFFETVLAELPKAFRFT